MFIFFIIWLSISHFCFGIDPLGRPQSWPVGIIVFTHVVRPSVRMSVPTFQNLAKQIKAKTMFATGETVGLAEWIIDDPCLGILFCFIGWREFGDESLWLERKAKPHAVY